MHMVVAARLQNVQIHLSPVALDATLGQMLSMELQSAACTLCCTPLALFCPPPSARLQAAVSHAAVGQSAH
jgi:hypothetical protein